MAHLLIIQHVPHERLGSFEPVFTAAGCSLRVLRAAEPGTVWPATLEGIHGIVSMGGPQSVYEQARFPFLRKELRLLEGALRAERPILGVCLGAQLLAAALGAKVTKNSSKEIGWYPLMRESAADSDPLCEPFGQTETVFQWHGDTFALPRGAVQLFSSPLCAQQGFRFGGNVYGLQFHVEVTEAMIRAWLREAGNKRELAALKGQIDPAALRAQTPRHLPRLSVLAQRTASTFARLAAPSPATAPPRKAIAHARGR